MRKNVSKNVFGQLSLLREQLKDLNDYLDLLEARVRNKSKKTFTIKQVRKQLGLVSCET